MTRVSLGLIQTFSIFRNRFNLWKFITNSYDLGKKRNQDQNSSKIELYAMNPCLSEFGSFEFSLLLCAILDVANVTRMRSFVDSEEN